MFARISKAIRNNVLVGLLLVTPLVITAIVVNWLFKLATNQLIALLPKQFQDSSYEILFRFAALFMVLLLLFFVGLLVRNIIGKRLYQFGEKFLGSIPVVNRIYLWIRQIIETLFTQRQSLFKEVVIIEYPRIGIYTMGFVTATVPVPMRSTYHLPDPAQDYVSVFIPTTPNPTSGWLCVVPRTSVKHVDISTSDAMKFIISGGAVFPGNGEAAVGPTLLDKLDDWIRKEGKH